MITLGAVLIVAMLIVLGTGWHSASQKNQDLVNQLANAQKESEVTIDHLEKMVDMHKTLNEENIKWINQGVIVGRAFIDNAPYDAFNAGDWPAESLQVALLKKTGETLQTASVKNGEYSFRVEPGIYLVQPILAIPGYPGWNYSANLRYEEIKVSAMETTTGPIFLVRNR